MNMHLHSVASKILLWFALPMLLLPIVSKAQEGAEQEEYPYHLAAKPERGSGSAEDPYQIDHIYQLVWMAQQVNTTNDLADVHFVQTKDLDFSETQKWENGEGWMPIGGFYSIGGIPKKFGFRGHYDGQGYRIVNLKINRPKYPYQGLFGYINSGEVRNLIIEKAEIIGQENVGCLTAYVHNSHIVNCQVIDSRSQGKDFYVGLLAGYQDGGLIEDCIVKGEVYGRDYLGGITSWNNEGEISGCTMEGKIVGKVPEGTPEDALARVIGGIAGYIRGKISYCMANVEMTGDEKVGGLLGVASRAEVRRSYVIGGWIKGQTYVGGLIGENDTSIIEDCYARAKVQGERNVGGLLGSSSYSDSRVTRCYSTGEVKAENPSFGGAFIGVKSTGVVSKCYWNTETSNMQEAVGGFYHEDIQCDGKTSEEMKKQNTYEGWDFSQVWMISPSLNEGYPTLRGKDSYPLDNAHLPNPTIQLTATADGYHIDSEEMIEQIDIFSTDGQKVYSRQVKANSCRVATNSLPKGLHVLRVKTGHKAVSFKLFLDKR
ncbi:GLUG motif-containing protein [Porphyromonas crevioricanis]|uniref:GLUG domain-containing protein n=2 Tax=Porphyromonas crevioricanis TaxID=393921 RepID=A0AB34PHY3_9PORP|nr:T9SS type A sorting domain-containing protein [Porphyromonas crevioricanis]KGN94935.1 hypothetical protein HQ38_05285 [Porphyromonas crevioricanis]GAD08017.1 surface proteins containing Ig-like domains-like [Porphyromonas crevioricanis JCM 13913]